MANRAPSNKNEWNTYGAFAWLPYVKLGNRGGKWSMGVDVNKGKEFIGSFYIGQGGVTFVKKHERDRKSAPKGKRVTWRALARIISES